jgi:hypothetical protein
MPRSLSYGTGARMHNLIMDVHQKRERIDQLEREIDSLRSTALGFPPNATLVFRFGPGGALLCDTPIHRVTRELDAATASFYGGRHFVAESMSREAAATLAGLLGGTLADDPG